MSLGFLSKVVIYSKQRVYLAAKVQIAELPFLNLATTTMSLCTAKLLSVWSIFQSTEFTEKMIIYQQYGVLSN